MTNTQDALEAWDNFVKNSAHASAWFLPDTLDKIRTALSHTYDPETHILVAREDYASLLRFKFCLHNAYKYCVFNEDRATPKNIMEAIEKDLGAHIDALLAQKTEE